MVSDHTPYDYGGTETNAVGDDPPRPDEREGELVIVDGSSMSYRRYRRGR
ncbi:MAG: hypothetical protein ACOCQ7_02485 [Natronomonas sp.]